MLKRWAVSLSGGNVAVEFVSSEHEGEADHVCVMAGNGSIDVTPNEMDQIVAWWVALRHASENARNPLPF